MRYCTLWHHDICNQLCRLQLFLWFRTWRLPSTCVCQVMNQVTGASIPQFHLCYRSTWMQPSILCTWLISHTYRCIHNYYRQCYPLTLDVYSSSVGFAAEMLFLNTLLLLLWEQPSQAKCYFYRGAAWENSEKIPSTLIKVIMSQLGGVSGSLWILPPITMQMNRWVYF